jgi:hypothetical protein
VHRIDLDELASFAMADAVDDQFVRRMEDDLEIIVGVAPPREERLEIELRCGRS